MEVVVKNKILIIIAAHLQKSWAFFIELIIVTMDLIDIKTKLESISNFVFHSSSNNKMNGLEGMGGGAVTCIKENENSLLFYEHGRFNNSFNKSMKCNNIYRWSFHYLDNKIALQHVRFGLDNPVFLFDLIFDKENRMISQNPHICKDDKYSAEMIIETSTIKLNWVVKSLIKYNRMEYLYE